MRRRQFITLLGGTPRRGRLWRVRSFLRGAKTSGRLQSAAPLILK
jgi:hypothetical protein